MARFCQITQKRTRSGNNVSHSQRKTKRTFAPNVHLRKLLNPATGTVMRVKLSTQALRTLAKWDREGKMYDLRTLIKKRSS